MHWMVKGRGRAPSRLRCPRLAADVLPLLMQAVSASELPLVDEAPQSTVQAWPTSREIAARGKPTAHRLVCFEEVGVVPLEGVAHPRHLVAGREVAHVGEHLPLPVDAVPHAAHGPAVSKCAQAAFGSAAELCGRTELHSARRQRGRTPPAVLRSCPRTL